MTRPYNAVLFDLDGTLLDSFQFHSEVTYRYLISKGYNPTKQQVSSHIGNTLECVLSGCDVPSLEQASLVQQFDAFYIHQSEDLLQKLKLEPQAVLLVRALKEAGIKTGIVTNSKHALVEEILRQNGLLPYFDILSGATEHSLNKESRCHDVLRELCVLPEKTLYVGDTRYDIMLARQCGMDVCILDHKIGWESDYEQLAQEFAPDYVVQSFSMAGALLL